MASELNVGGITTTGNVGVGGAPVSAAGVARFLYVGHSDHAGVVLDDTDATPWEIYNIGGALYFSHNGTTSPLTIDSAGLCSLSNGIAFSSQTDTSATGAAATSTTLDHYEEGTWTPTLLFGGANVSQTGTYVGRYTRVGGVVTLTGRIALTAKGSSTGAPSVGGLPFASANVANQWTAASLYFSGVTFADFLQAYNYPNEALIHPQEVSNAGVTSALSEASFTDTSQITISLVYHV